MMSGMLISTGPAPPPATAPVSVAPSPSPAPAPALASTTGSEFVLSVEERQRYEQTFARADDDLDGFVSGEQARALFAKSGLPFSDLRKIWTLSDIDQDHRLSLTEFCVAMFLINSRLRGMPTPDQLPASLLLSIRPTGINTEDPNHHHPSSIFVFTLC